MGRDAQVRIERLVEAIQIIRGMWTHDRFSFKGKYYSIHDAACLPRPIQKPAIKIIVGGKGEKLLLPAVAKYADGWNIDELPADDYSRKLEVIRKNCVLAGTNYDRIEKSLEQYLLITDSPDQEQRILEWTKEQSAKNPERQRLGKPPSAPTLEQLRKEYIFGTVEEVTERFAEYIKVGVERFMIYFLDYPTMNSILLFAREVLPSLTS